MDKTKYWMLLVFASEAYTLVVPLFLFACSGIFGLHTMLNVPVFDGRSQARAIANAFGIIFFLNCFCFIVLLTNLFVEFCKKGTRKIIVMVFFLGLNGIISAMLYPATIFVPTF